MNDNVNEDMKEIENEGMDESGDADMNENVNEVMNSTENEEMNEMCL
jgi:hypothetical protein